MIRLDAALVVEGKYDRMKLKEVVDGVILCTDGFRLFRDREKCALLKALADSVGLVVLTDSDAAGLQIRNYIRSVTQNSPNVVHLYIPQIVGKERRKTHPSKEGTLGVEGMEAALLEALLQKLPEQTKKQTAHRETVTKGMLYEDGLSGRAESARRRKKLAGKLGVPDYLSANALLEYINAVLTPEEYRALVRQLANEEEQTPE